MFSEHLSDGLHISFHFALVLRMAYAAGIDETAIMFGHLPIYAVEFWIIKVRFDNAAFEIVDQDSSGDAAKKVEHSNMRGDKTLLILFINKLDKLVAAVRKCGNESIDCLLFTAKECQLNNLPISG